MSLNLDIFEEDRQAVINSDRSKINSIWHTLTDKQQEDLFSLSIQERNMIMIDFFYHKKETAQWQLLNPALIEAGKNDDIEIVKLCIMNTEYYRKNQKEKSIEDNIASWALYNDCLNLVLQLDIDKIYAQIKQDILYLLTNRGFINEKNQIDSPNLLDQQLLDHLEKYQITMMTHFRQMFNRRLSIRNNLEEIEKFYKQYIDNPSYLTSLIAHDPVYYGNNVEYAKKKLATFGFGKGADLEELEYIDYFVQKGADIHHDNGDSMHMILCSSNEAMIDKILTLETKEKLTPYYTYVLTYQEQIYLLKKFFHLFENEEEATKVISERGDFSEKEEILAYIKAYSLEKKLQRELNEKEVMVKRKI